MRNLVKQTLKIIFNTQLIFALAVSSSLTPILATQTATAAAPPVPEDTFTVLAAGERSAAMTVTAHNATTVSNGTGWYLNGQSMGFAPEGAAIEQDSADTSGIYTEDTAANAYRLSWHTGSGGAIMNSGWRAGTHTDLGYGWTRYVYQSNSLPSYYPSGPQASIGDTTVTNGGWTLCWSGSYGDSGKSITDLFNTDCTGTYIMYAASGGNPENKLEVKKDGSSVLQEIGGSQNESKKLYVGDTLSFSLQLNDGVTDTPWSHYRVYLSNCIVSDGCWPGNPVDTPEHWDNGTVVTNGTYTIPAGAEQEELYIYQADDSTNEALTSVNAVRLTVSHTPVVRTISSCEQLAAIDDNIDNYEFQDTYKLTKDIDCTGVDLDYGLDFDGAFEGVFDGQGHIISNLTVNQPTGYYVGLFRNLDSATVKNLTLSGGSVTGTYEVGALAGEAYNTNIINVHSNLNVTATDNYGYYAGGLVGYYELEYDSASISNVSSTGDVSAFNGYAGGIIAYLDLYGYNDLTASELTIEKTFYKGTVSSESSYVGGLIGYAYVENEDDGYEPARLSIKNSYTQGTVNSGDGSDAGGLIGYAEMYNDEYDSTAETVIDRSYSSSSIIGDSEVGGLIGELDLDYQYENTRITNSFVAGSVEARDGSSYAIVGSEGFDYDEDQFSMSNVYFDKGSTNQSYPTYNETDGWTMVNTMEDQQPNYFKNNTTHPPLNTWDFATIWLSHANDYPTLRETIGTTQLASAENGSKITVAQIGCDTVENTSTTKEASLDVQDPAYKYPLGFAGFHLAGCTVGGTATVTVTFTGTFNPSDVTARKYNPETNGFTTITHASKSKITLDGSPTLRITYTITDGGDLDQDGTANGTIVDPVGLAIQSVGAPNTGVGTLR